MWLSPSLMIYRCGGNNKDDRLSDVLKLRHFLLYVSIKSPSLYNMSWTITIHNHHQTDPSIHLSIRPFDGTMVVKYANGFIFDKISIENHQDTILVQQCCFTRMKPHGLSQNFVQFPAEYTNSYGRHTFISNNTANINSRPNPGSIEICKIDEKPYVVNIFCPVWFG